MSQTAPLSQAPADTRTNAAEPLEEEAITPGSNMAADEAECLAPAGMPDGAAALSAEDGFAASATFRLWPLVVQAFACTMAMMSFTALMGPIGRSVGVAPWQMGVALTVSGLAWMLTARPWGMASDRLGRRPVLLMGVGGFVVSYTALCLFIAWSITATLPALLVFAGLVFWRTIAGACYAVVPAAGTALIADHVPPRGRAAAMATVGMATGASMVIGPAVAGALATFGLHWPLIVVTVAPMVALLVLWLALPAEAPRLGHVPMTPPSLTDRRLRPALTAAFVSMFAVSVAQIVIGFYAIDRLGLSPQAGAQVAGWGLTCVGVGLTLAQVAVRKLSVDPLPAVRVGAVIAAMGFGAVMMATSALILCACYFVAACGMGIIWPSLSAMAANAVTPQEQGTAAGSVSAAQGLGTIVGPLLGTLIYGASQAAPYAMVGALLLLLALVLGPLAKKMEKI